MNTADRTRPAARYARAAGRSLRSHLYALCGAALTLFAAFIWLGVSGKPDLKPWHTAMLDPRTTQRAVRTIRVWNAAGLRNVRVASGSARGGVPGILLLPFLRCDV